MKTHTQQSAVIYCRVSSTKQTTQGDGLASQETRCREYARYKGYRVIEVFRDDVSGGLIDRPGMQAMLKFLKRQGGQSCAVIIDDISRLARGLEAHLKLRSAIGSVGGRLESPSIEFGEDSDSQLVENMLASVSQHQRQKNGEQTRNRMRARAMNGYWVFGAIFGYRFERVSGHGKMMVRDEPLASIVAEALEGFACGRFDTQAEVKRFLAAHPEFPRDSRGEIRNQRVTDILTNTLYAGYIDLANWSVRLQPAKHEPLIGFDTFRAIQRRLKEGARVPARKDLHESFPLRGFVLCGDCGKPLTACYSRGRARQYPYYLCPTKGCASYGKSIRREKLEGDFDEEMRALCPTEEAADQAVALFRELWDSHNADAEEQVRDAKAELAGIEQKVGALLDRIMAASSETVIAAYENRIRSLEERRAELDGQTRKRGVAPQSFDERFRTAMSFLRNPQKLWISERLEDRRTALKLVFAERPAYARNGGVRTAGKSLPFWVLDQLKGGSSKMASPRGVEPLFSA